MRGAELADNAAFAVSPAVAAAMDPSQRPTSNNPPNPYGQPQAPAYGYPYGQAPPAQAFQAPQQAYYQTPARSDVFAALAQAPPVYEALIGERDRYMAHALRDCEGSSVVGVVGGSSVFTV